MITERVFVIQCSTCELNGLEFEALVIVVYKTLFYNLLAKLQPNLNRYKLFVGFGRKQSA